MRYKNIDSEQRVIVIGQNQIGPQNISGLGVTIGQLRKLGEEGKLAITHCNELYMLRVTRKGKLILTK